MIAALPPKLRRAVSPYTGIVSAVEECCHTTAEPPLHRATCESTGGHGGDGWGATRHEAASAAVGEAVERYSAAYVPTERLVVATAREISSAAVAPERFALFSDSQYETAGFPFRRFDSDTRVAWVAGRSLVDGREAWLPAELVFLSSVSGDDAPIGYATSNGAACAEEREDAVARGLCELLERDAFMLAWSARLSLPLLDWTEHRHLTKLDRCYFAPTGLAYSAIDLSPVHRVPSVLAVVRARAGCAGALGVGAGTAATVERAWWKAMSEAFATRAAGVKLALVEEPELGAAGEIVSFEDHIRWYADHEHANAAAFLDASDARTRTFDVEPLRGDLVAVLARRIVEAGSSAYAVDVTAPDVAELGLHVAKVIAPELCALDVPHKARFLGGTRLYEAAAALGFRDRPLTETEINPDPHPFP